MRDGQLTTLDEEALLVRAEEYARRIDQFLIEREHSVLSKLVAIGGAREGESFEVQAKARLADPAAVLAALCWPDLEILYERHYREYDTYFSWTDPDQGQLRYREDEFLDADGGVSNVRYRLTLLGPAREGRFESDVVLSRSRFLAPATHSLRFYREYFKPARERLHPERSPALARPVPRHRVLPEPRLASSSPTWATSSRPRAAPGAAAMRSTRPSWRASSSPAWARRRRTRWRRIMCRLREQVAHRMPWRFLLCALQ